MIRRAFLLAIGAALADPRAPLAQFQAGAPVVSSGDSGFDAWAQSFFQRSVAAGMPEAFLRRELSGLRPDERVVALDNRQPELSRPASAYIRTAVNDGKVMRGRAKKSEVAYWLAGIERRSGVPADVLVGVWGMESDFGAVMGDYDVIRSLATLAYDGRRREWAETQLTSALRIVLTNQASRGQLKGSWAGAMGQTQFLPQTFLAQAIDGDNDGRRDIWGSAPDALASAGNLLEKAGWRRGESWAREVLLPEGFDYTSVEGPRYPLSRWLRQGVRRADGRAWSDADRASECGLILPAGASGPAFLVFPNHFVIRAYNNSISYALAVGLLGDRVGGAQPLITPWPNETPIPRDDRIGAQRALNLMGFNAGEADGAVGVNTRAAVRAWQRSKAMIPDGHLTLDIARRLQREAGLAPATGN